MIKDNFQLVSLSPYDRLPQVSNIQQHEAPNGSVLIP